jgi:tetratricopeptide (TPR) repeat protein
MTGALAWLTWTLECLGEFKEGLVTGRRAIETAEAQGDRLLGVAAYLYLAVVHLGRGDRASALPLLERAMAQCRAYREGDLLGPVSMRLGLVYCQLGRIEEGIALGEEGMAHFSVVPTVTGLPTRLAAVAESYLLAGRTADAADTAHRGLALAREHHQPWGEAACLRALGLIAAASTPPDTTAAERHFTHARDLATELEMRPLAAHCNLDLARLWSAAGRRAEACEHLALATETYRTLDMPGWLTTASAEADRLGLASA